jgi:hypothetical protein
MRSETGGGGEGGGGGERRDLGGGRACVVQHTEEPAHEPQIVLAAGADRRSFGAIVNRSEGIRRWRERGPGDQKGTRHEWGHPSCTYPDHIQRIAYIGLRIAYI